MPDPILAANLADCPRVRHGFFTRHGGVSDGLYTSLNCGLGSGDRPEAVRRNRASVAGVLGAKHLLTAHQVHGIAPVVAEQAWEEKERPKADAIITKTPGLAVGVLTADCAPVLLADPDARIVAAIHAGWRGALSGVIEATLSRMESLGAQTRRLWAAVGPCIGQAAYEVGPDFERQFLERDPQSRRFFVRPDPAARPYFDLSGYLVERLERAGVNHVHSSGLCTFSQNGDFFSYRGSQSRGEPDYGRQISAIVLT